MVGIVIVSHSRRLAEGVQELALQMVKGNVQLAIAAGIDDPDNPLGTDAIKVQQAIESVYNDAGVVVLMDLGSALMSAEMALEFLPEEQRQNVHLCEASLVEGAIAAVVAAATGNDIAQVMAEAKNALAAKATQLGMSGEKITPILENQRTLINQQPIHEIRMTIRNRLGLHARPAAQFVATAAQFQSQIQVRNLTRKTDPVRADSMNQVTLLGVRQGHELAITAQGSDAEAALDSLKTLIENNFGEADIPTESQPVIQILQSTREKLVGISASPGVAIAPLIQYRPAELKVPQRAAEAPQAEWQRLQTALQAAQQDIHSLRQQTASQSGAAEAVIFDAHQQFLNDPVLNEAVRRRIFEQRMTAETAWQDAIEDIANSYRQLDDAYLQARAIDIVDVGQRVLKLLIGTGTSELTLTQPSILVAEDLTPSDTTQLDPTQVLGICTALGSATSHSAILARTLGIPSVVGIGSPIVELAEGTLLALDGETGEVWIQPESETLTALQAKREVWQAVQQQAREMAHQPAITRDDRQISVLANIGGIADARRALEFGAEGVGLLRTEFLYLDRTTAPSETEQFAVYQAIAQIMGTRPFIIRTLDVGGDKPLPYLKRPLETNPFLGYRGIRVSLDYPELFKTQLRAILRASPGHQIKIMFPMIATVTEVKAAKAMLAEVQADLRRAGILFDEALQVGIMVEVPSAVAIADQLASEVDFFSIGTNDLSQYVMAADRTNAQVASLADALHPAVLRAVQQTIQAGHSAGIWVGLCGELAADSVATPILLGLEIDEISLNAPAIPVIKQTISQLTLAQAEAVSSALCSARIAVDALQLDTAARVRAFVSTQLSRC
jgi:phosphocarrier protein FPr